MVCGRGSGRSQLKSVSGTDRVRLCGHVKLSPLNSADYPEYPDRKVGLRACATSSASCGLWPRQSFHSKGSDKIYKKKCSVVCTLRSFCTTFACHHFIVHIMYAFLSWNKITLEWDNRKNEKKEAVVGVAVHLARLPNAAEKTVKRRVSNYTFSHCESASVHLKSADCIGVVSWDTTPTKVASYQHSAPL